jgi:hypothetical protein
LRMRCDLRTRRDPGRPDAEVAAATEVRDLNCDLPSLRVFPDALFGARPPLRLLAVLAPQAVVSFLLLPVEPLVTLAIFLAGGQSRSPFPPCASRRHARARASPRATVTITAAVVARASVPMAAIAVPVSGLNPRNAAGCADAIPIRSLAS